MTAEPAREDDVIGTQEACQILGVDRSTLRQYANLPHWLTPGGHKRYSRREVVAFRDRVRGPVCGWCPPGCVSCEPSDCECYTHQDEPDRRVRASS